MLVVLLFFNKKGGEATGTGVETPAFAGVSLFCTFCFVYDFGVAVFLLLLIYKVKRLVLCVNIHYLACVKMKKEM